MKTLYLIPARGGSKGIPGKNIKLLGGKPLILYSVEVARELSADEFICVSTDSDEIIELVENAGLKVPFKRPSNLATDSSSSYDVIIHALKEYEANGIRFNNVVLLQPTSPFRKVEHVQNALSLFEKTIDMVVSVNKVKSNFYATYYKAKEQGYISKLFEMNTTDVRRQATNDVFELNGAVYVLNVDSVFNKPMHDFRSVKKVEMDELSSADIDEPLDWEWCEFLIARNDRLKQRTKQ